ncbi:hypothetical protein HCH_02390 [Hahella chejuensis KCTC 2396]|uniref:Oligosaccharide repeat unit polymerase n=1 Tax=Hahella chejuensis (strain KCTC 2396) TaxID=349521 RepID=Q2SJH0_HAHCH|nr:hypothetical protein [Hahella chejuensis]ABC29204.1 hypothetical protein HCH_02390 [Hahella chejuensis KCTC 2396]
MLLAFLATSCALIVGLWLYDTYRVGISKSCLNHFWFFSLLWIIYFPFRGVLIDQGIISLQVTRDWQESDLVTSLFVASLFWIFVLIGYLSLKGANRDLSVKGGPRIQFSSFKILLLVGLAWAFLFSRVIHEGVFVPFHGNEQNEMRTGGGHIFLFSELYSNAFFSYICIFLIYKKKPASDGAFLLVVSAVLLTSLAMTVALASRRIISMTIFVLAVCFVVRRGKGTFLAPALILSSIFLAPLLHTLRYTDPYLLISDDVSVWKIILNTFVLRNFLTSLSSSFEGIDHLAAFLEKSDLNQLLFGVDGGMAWVFNLLLGAVPRAIWSSKPEIYGSISEQQFLYPWMYENGSATTTLPSSFVVDFIFGMGIFVGLLISFFMGRLFKVLYIKMWMLEENYAGKAISIFILANLFNIVRGGTGFAQPLIIFLIASVIVLGAGRVFRESKSIIKAVLNFNGDSLKSDAGNGLTIR